MSAPERQPSIGDVLAHIAKGLSDGAPVVPQADRLEWLEPEHRDGSQHMAFRVGGVLCTVPLDQLAETLPPPPLSRIPSSPDWLVGVTNLRGDLVSIVGLSRLFALDERQQGRQGVLVAMGRAKDNLVGFLVDEVIGIRRTTESPHAASAETRLHEFSNASVATADGDALILDLKRLAESPQIHLLESAA